MADLPRDPECIFCKIVDGSLPAAVVTQSDRVAVFMDAFPAAHGHALVVPRGHYADLFEMPRDLLQELIATVQEVALAIRAVVAPDGITVNQFNGRAAGQTVFHYHVHLIPRWSGQERRHHGERQESSELLEEVAAAIAADRGWSR